MTENGRIDDWALHAYIDNELSIEQRAEIEARLHADPEAARRVDAWRQQRGAMKLAFDGVLAEPLPRSLQATLRTGGTLSARPYLAMAASLVLLLLGGMAGFFMASDTRDQEVANIAERALVAHAVYAVEVRHPVEVDATDREHLQNWLSKRIGTGFKAPDLAAEGYTLLGGRLLADKDRPAAQLMYEDAARNRITIYLISNPENSETALHVEQQGTLTACYWLDGALGFVVAGEMERDPMMKLAHIIYDKFEG